MMSSDLVLCHDSVKYEINKCLTTTKSLKKQIKLNLFEKNELELELDFSLLISKFLRIILKQLLSQKDNEINSNPFIELFDMLTKKHPHSQYFKNIHKKIYLKNFNLVKKTYNLPFTKLGLTYMRYLNYYLIKLNNKLYIILSHKSINCLYLTKFAFNNTIVMFLSKAFYLFMLNRSNDCLFNINSHSPRWMAIHERTEIIMNTSFYTGILFQRLFNIMSNLTHALFNVVMMDKFTLSMKNLLNFCYSGVYLALRPSLSKTLRKFFNLNQRFEIVASIADSIENRFVNVFYNLTLGNIKYNKTFYINIKEVKDNFIYEKEIINGKEVKLTRIRLISKYDVKLNTTSIPIKSSYFNFPFRLFTFKSNEQPCLEFDVIFNVHGGGFFAQTSKSHLHYLINFANETNSIIFSVDYTVAPKQKYPDIFRENMLAYEKIMNNFQVLFNFKIKKLILFGDSGGAHLCLSILKHAIANKIRIPDSLILIYPCSRIIFDTMSPSLLLSCHDSFIEHSIMDHIQSSVLDLDANDLEYYEDDSYLNFYLTEKEVIKKFPPTTVIIASDDPLKDESYKLSDFLLQNQVKVEIKEFLYHPHGFINLGNVIPHFRKSEKVIIDIIKNILK